MVWKGHIMWNIEDCFLKMEDYYMSDIKYSGMEVTIAIRVLNRKTITGSIIWDVYDCKVSKKYLQFSPVGSMKRDDYKMSFVAVTKKQKRSHLV